MDDRQNMESFMELWIKASKSMAIQNESATAVQTSNANPIQMASVGIDQDVNNPKSVGATYDIKDLENLQSLKLKLHDLLGKLTGVESRGESNAKLESQIVSLQAKIDEFSSYLTTDFK